LLLTGRPGCGKTTVIQRTLALLSDVHATGFYTRELRQAGRRLGFEAVTLDGIRLTLAHVELARRSRHRVSRYGVDVAGFEAEIVPSIDPDQHPEAALIVVDEVGKMECFSSLFRETLLRALAALVPLLGTIALRGNRFIESVKARPDVQVIRVTHANRDELPARLADDIRQSRVTMQDT